MRILSIVGGGIKGYAEALWLDALEQRMGAPLVRRVDLVAGTSIGALIGCGIASGMEPHRMATLMREIGPQIFRRPGWSRWLTDLWDRGLSRPRYASEPVARALLGVFGTERLGSLSVRTLLTAYEATRPDFVALKSWSPQWCEMPIWSACMASSAAPGYFPGHVTGKRGWVDGGLAANDPAACALAEALRLGSAREAISLVCVSAGDEPAPATTDDLREWGGAEWALRIIPAMFHAQVRCTSYVVRQLLPEGRCVQVRLPLENGALDDASKENLLAMELAVEKHLCSPEGQRELDRAAQLLAPPAPAPARAA